MQRKHTTILATFLLTFFAGVSAIADDTERDAGHQGPGGDMDKRMAHRGQREFMRPEQMIHRMTRRLDLDETQAEQVRSIVSGASAEFESLREKGQANRSAMRDLDVADADYDAKLQDLSRASGELAISSTELRGRIRAEIHAILTPEQREELAVAGDRGRKPGQRNRHDNESRPRAR